MSIQKDLWKYTQHFHFENHHNKICRQSYHDRAPVEIRHKAPTRLHGIRNGHRARLADVDFVHGDFQHSSSHLEPQESG